MKPLTLPLTLKLPVRTVGAEIKEKEIKTEPTEQKLITLKLPTQQKVILSEVLSNTTKAPTPLIKNPIVQTKTGLSFSNQISKKKIDEQILESRRREELLPGLQVISTTIKFYSYKELKDIAVVEVNKPLQSSNSDTEILNENNLLNTVYDQHMGVIESDKLCATCNKDTYNCSGHPGIIELARPIFNPEGLDDIIKILKSLCNDCVELLLDKETIIKKGILKTTGMRRLNILAEESSKVKCKNEKCIINPTFLMRKTKEQNSGKIIAEYKESGNKIEKFYTAEDVLERFKALSPETIELLGFENGATPRDLIMEALYVIPTISRVPTVRDGIVTPHDLTIMYEDIIKYNNLLKIEIERNKQYNTTRTELEHKISDLQRFSKLDNEEKERMINLLEVEAKIQGTKSIAATEYKDYEKFIKSYQTKLNKLQTERTKTKTAKQKPEDEIYRELYTKVQHFINNADGSYIRRADKQYKSIKDHINGKEEIVRGLLMGKRTNYAARSVLSPDPSLKFGQIRIPRIWASILTQPVKVFSANLDLIRNLNEQGKISAHIATNGKFRGIRKIINSNNRNTIVIEIGDTVERHLEEGDMILFNRQPTIHKESMLGYEVVFGDELTIGLHPSVCVAHNADNDGDEGNIHALQILDAIIEAHRIVNSKQCIMSSQSNRNIMNVHMDPVQASYMMTRDRVAIMDDDDYFDCILLLTEVEQLTDLDIRLNKYNVTPKTGPALFSALFPRNFFYSKGNVRILEGILVTGTITKDHLGNSKNSLIAAIYDQYGPARAASFITDTNYLGNRYALAYPFSVKYSDCLIEGEEHEKLINEQLTSARIAANNVERQRELRNRADKLRGKKENQLEIEREEKEIINIVNTTRNIGVRVTEKILGPNNGLAISINSKVKGDVFNVAQITAIVGQQFLNNKRLPKQMTDESRCSPYFPPGDTSIEAQGFCSGNFFQGLRPAEQMFLQTGARENTIESIVKVPLNGDLAHRMAKNFEDITISNNGTITNSRDLIYQFSYEDTFATNEMNFVQNAEGEKLSFFNFKILADKLNTQYGYGSMNIMK
jgi:DNA-directed RNA polymerase beta' subunit